MVQQTYESINYWQTIPWDTNSSIEINDKTEKEDEEREKKDEKPIDRRSVWEALQAGEKLSDKKWGDDEESDLSDQAYYKHLITLGQFKRLNEIVNSKPELISREFSTFFEQSQLIDEFIKRADLSVRDERESLAFLNMSLIPMLIVAATAKKKDIISEEGGYAENRGRWNMDDLEEWSSKIMDNVPYEREGIKGYREAMRAFFDFYATQFMLMASREGVRLKSSEVNETYRLKNIFEEDIDVKVDYLSTHTPQESSLGRK